MSKLEEVVFIYKRGVKVPTDATKIIFDASVTEIPDGQRRKKGMVGVFSHCKQLKEVVFNGGLKRIGGWAFCHCTSLVIIKFPSTLTETEVGKCAFWNCTNLKEVVLNEGLQTIEGTAFRDCISLEHIKFPSTLSEVGGCAFGGCTNLKEVVFNEGLQRIGGWAFYDCTSLESIDLPSTVTEVGKMVFWRCTNLKEVVLNEGLQTIKRDAFSECLSLQSIALPTSLAKIEKKAFQECVQLKDVQLNEGLQEIEEDAFYNCTSLNVVKFSAISKRANHLIEAGQTDLEDKLAQFQYLEWRSGEYVVTPEAVVTISEHWKAIRRGLDKILVWIEYYELLEATATIELALWKGNISETSSALTVDEREGCRTEVPGPVKDAILQYLGSKL